MHSYQHSPVKSQQHPIIQADMDEYKRFATLHGYEGNQQTEHFEVVSKAVGVSTFPDAQSTPYLSPLSGPRLDRLLINGDRAEQKPTDGRQSMDETLPFYTRHLISPHPSPLSTSGPLCSLFRTTTSPS
ncbi:hypothetical protein PGT21_034706 [Puccinia graminis f. sp. tritici]|uniref:Uncharacterized protein n=1 Tax=Puccinia graminis f. sp. tritici TaxID=56615 RepID=A0A5B0PZQ2_PUCGR|nr:hypothetical protein PGT21_034706 [Puccinia graminis f. sp. tritici]